MRQHNIISLYLGLSAANGIVPVGIALIFSVPVLGIFAIWALTTMITFVLVCLVCLRNTRPETNPKIKTRRMRSEIERAYF